MASYTSNLKSWGATGQEYPDGYSYLEGEQPVDAWDNFLTSEVVTDIKDHLIPLTNSRVESDKGAAGGEPTSPDASHLYYDEDGERLEHYDASLDSWHGLMKVDGDTMEGALDMGGYDISGVGSVTLSGTIDGVDVSAHAGDGAAHHTRYGDSEARTAVDGSSVSITGSAATAGDSDTVRSFAVVTGGADAIDCPSYATLSDVPALSAGNIVYVEGENKHYFEDGT